MGKLFSIVKSSKERVDPLSGDKAVMQTGAVTLLTSHLEGDLEGGRDSLRGAGPWWQKTTQSNLQKRQDLPGCPVVETLGFQCRGLGRSPGWGTNISHAMLHGQKNRKKKKINQFKIQRSRKVSLKISLNLPLFLWVVSA